MTEVIFDWDGTLVDTKRAVRHAYDLAGVNPRLAEINWGRPWQEWVTKEQHDAKSAHYSKLVRDGWINETSLCCALRQHSEWFAPKNVITGASRDATEQVYVVMHKYVGPVNFLGFSCDVDLKRSVLVFMGEFKQGEELIYVDDHLDLGLQVVRGTSFKLAHYDSTREEVTIYEGDGRIAWMPSYSQLGLMSVLEGSLPRITNPCLSSEDNLSSSST